MHYACVFSTLPVVKYLLFVGADPTKRDGSGKTMVELAKQRGAKAMYQFMSAVTQLYAQSEPKPRSQRSKNAANFDEVSMMIQGELFR